MTSTFLSTLTTNEEWSKVGNDNNNAKLYKLSSWWNERDIEYFLEKKNFNGYNSHKHYLLL